MDAQLARKLQERRSVVDTDGNAWETLPQASSADARGEWLLVDGVADLDLGITEQVWASSSSEDDLLDLSQGALASSGSLAGPPTQTFANGYCDEAASGTLGGTLPTADASGEHVLGVQGVAGFGCSEASSSRPRGSGAAQREQIQRERAAWAADCAHRWPGLLGATEAFPVEEGTELSKSDLRVIHADVQRTRSADPFFQSSEVRERLSSMLTRFCQRENIRYMQGLHEVAAAFLFVESSAPADAGFGEAQAMACLAATTHRFVPYFHDGDAFVALHVSLLFFRQLILYHHPDLHNFLAEAGISPLLYATPWFITLFASRTPLSVLLRLWDRYFVRGDASFLPFLAVATLAAEKSEILATGKDDIHSAVVNVGIKTLERLDAVWDAADNLQRRTPQSFSLRLSRVLAAVMEKRGQPKQAEGSWSERVLDRVAKERHFSMIPGEAFMHVARRHVAPRVESSSSSTIVADANAEPEVVAPTASPQVIAAIQADAPPSESFAAGSQRKPEHAATRKLRLILLDVRGQAEYENEHLPQSVHFNPPCLRHLKASGSRSRGQFHIDRLADLLKEAVGSSFGGLLVGKAPTAAQEGATAGQASGLAPGMGLSSGPGGALLNEVFNALHAVVVPRWGEAWLSDSTCVHVVLLGGANDTESVDHLADGNVAPLYEALTEHLSLPRVSVALGGASAVHREANRRGLPLRRGAAAASPEAAAALLGSAASLGSSAWSLLRGASEALPAVDGAGAQLEGLLRSGAEVARSSAQVAAKGIAEGVTAVRQQAAEGLTVVSQKLNQDSETGAADLERSYASGIGTGVTCSTVGSELSTASEFSGCSERSSPSQTPRELQIRGARTWTCHIALPDGCCQEPVAFPDRVATICLTTEGQLLVADGAHQALRRETQVLISFSVRTLLRIGTSPTMPRTLSFYFSSNIGNSPNPAAGRPALIALFETAELARSCARALAVSAAADRRQRVAAASTPCAEPLVSQAQREDQQSPQCEFDPLAVQVTATTSVASPCLPDLWDIPPNLPDLWSSPPATDANIGIEAPIVAGGDVALTGRASGEADTVARPSTWNDVDDFLLELEQSPVYGPARSDAKKDASMVVTGSLTTTAPTSDCLDTEAFLRELDELAGLA